VSRHDIEIRSWQGAVLYRATVDAYDERAALRAVMKKAARERAALRGADLRGADLTGADLTDAVLRDAVLTGADLRGADLTGAVLTDADLDAVRDDFWRVLDAAPNEALQLAEALVAGQVNGSCYEGDCACLVGTIANARGCYYGELGALKPDANRPAECWFLGIRPGMSPEHSRIAVTLEWIDQWVSRHPEVMHEGVKS